MKKPSKKQSKPKSIDKVKDLSKYYYIDDSELAKPIYTKKNKPIQS